MRDLLQLGVNGKQALRLGRLLDPSLADLVLGSECGRGPLERGAGRGKAGLAS